MAPISFGGAQPPVGLDIDADFIRAARVKETSSGIQLIGYDTIPVPFGSVVEGEIVDPEAVSSAIRDLWRHAGIRTKDTCIGVSNQKVVVRLIDLPYMERAEFVGAMQYQAQDYIPIPVEEAIVDFQIIGDYMTPTEEHMMEVLLVAAHKDMISTAVSALEGAGLRPHQVDVTAFALVRALLGNDPILFADAFESSSVAFGIVHVTSSLTNIAVVERGIPRFTRVSSLAGNQLTQAVANVLNVTFAEADKIKNEAGLPALDELVIAPTTEDAQQIQIARDALEREAMKFVAEVRRSFDYYLTQTTAVRSVKRVYLTGSGAALQNFGDYLAKGLQTEVVIGDPLAHVTAFGAVESAVRADFMGCAPAIGLALGGVW